MFRSAAIDLLLKGELRLWSYKDQGKEFFTLERHPNVKSPFTGKPVKEPPTLRLLDDAQQSLYSYNDGEFFTLQPEISLRSPLTGGEVGSAVRVQNLQSTENPTQSRQAGEEEPTPYGLLCFLQALTLYYQSCHWTAKGPSFYSDHLLFGKLYEQTASQVDSLAESVVLYQAQFPAKNATFYGEAGMQPSAIAAAVAKKVSTFPDSVGVAQALIAETEFVRYLTQVSQLANVDPGFANLLTAMAETHNNHLYLLQRSTIV